MTNSLATKSTQSLNSALVITRDIQFITVVESTLSATSVSCVFADSMFKAAQMLQNGLQPAVILIDLSSSQAIKFVKEIKAHARYSQIPLLAVTQDPSLPEVKDAIAAGANRWLTKSFVGNTLLSVMRQFSAI